MALTSGKKLMMTEPRPKSRYIVFACYFNKDYDKTNPKSPSSWIIPLGGCSSKKIAEKYVRDLIELTGHHELMVVEHGTIWPVKQEMDEKLITALNYKVDQEGNIIRMDKELDAKTKEELQKLEEDSNKYNSYLERVQDESTKEHIQYHLHLASKLFYNIQEYEKNLKTMKEQYVKELNLIKNKYQTNKEVFPEALQLSIDKCKEYHVEHYIPHIKSIILDNQ